MMLNKISVIIPSFNCQSSIVECISSLVKQSVKPYEIIVVDNASTDGTYERVTNYKLQVKNLKIIKNITNLGVTGGRNRGIRNVAKDSNYLLFIDHDMVADEEMVINLVKVAKSDKKIGIVTPKIYYWVNKKRIWSAGTEINLWTGQVIFRGGLDHGQYDNVEEVQIAPAVMLVKKEVINKIHSFDDRYVTTYEDSDFCFRAKRAGYKTFYAPKAIAYHHLSERKEDEEARLLSRAYYVGRNRILFMKDYGKNYCLFLLLIPLYFIYYLRISIKNSNIYSIKQYLKGVMDALVDSK